MSQTHNRRCPGLGDSGKSCNRFLPSVDVDPHSKCATCRKSVCSREIPCPECLLWSEDQWKKFLKRQARSKSVSVSPSPMPPPPPSVFASRMDGLESSFASFRSDHVVLQGSVAALNQNVALILAAISRPPDQVPQSTEFLHVPAASAGLQAALGSQLPCGQRTPLLDERDPFLPQHLPVDGSSVRPAARPGLPDMVSVSSVHKSPARDLGFGSPQAEVFVVSSPVAPVNRSASPGGSLLDGSIAGLQHSVTPRDYHPTAARRTHGAPGRQAAGGLHPAAAVPGQGGPWSPAPVGSCDADITSAAVAVPARSGPVTAVATERAIVPPVFDVHDPLGLALLYPDPTESSMQRARSPPRGSAPAMVRPRDGSHGGSTRQRSGDRPRSPRRRSPHSSDRHGSYYSSYSRHRSPSGPRESRRHQDRHDVSHFTESGRHHERSYQRGRSPGMDSTARSDQRDRSSPSRADRQPHGSSLQHDVKASCERERSPLPAQDLPPKRTPVPRLDASSPQDVDTSIQEKEAEVRFQQVQSWIQRMFPDLIPDELKQERKFSSFAEAQLDSSAIKRQDVTLPWSSGVSEAKGQLQNLLIPKKTGAPAFKAGKFLPPGPQLKFYKVRGDETAPEPAQVNPALASLSSSSAPLKPSFSMTEDDLKSVESAARRQLQVSSTLDWQCATAGKFVKDLLPEGDDEPQVEVQDLEALRRVVLSMSRSIAQLNKDNALLLANTLLRRRDGYIKALPSIVPEDQRLRLRSEGLFSSSQLFDQKQLETSIEKVRQDSSMKSSLKTAQLVDKLSSQKQPTQSNKPGGSKAKVYASDFPKGHARKPYDKGSFQKSYKKPYQKDSYKKDSYKASAGAGRAGAPKSQ